MSIIYSDSNWYFLDHKEFFVKVLKKVLVNVDVYQSFTIREFIFSILKHKMDKVNGRKKRKKEVVDLHIEALMVQGTFQKALLDLPREYKDYYRCKYKCLQTSLVRDLSKQLFESTVFNHNGISGGNKSDYSLKCKIGDDHFLIPDNCRFLCGNVVELCHKLIGNKYNILIADPPWWNKYIRRLKEVNNKLSYSMMYNEEIASIPVKNLLAADCLVAVWCTNAPSNIVAVKDLIFPAWGVEFVTTWYWLKVTIDLEPICDFESGFKKQPYERIILGKVGTLKKNIQSNQLVISVPSTLHSHKPPLLDLLTPYVNAENPQILELFARYLLPNTTSVGYEPLKWQHISLYEEVIS